MKPTASVRKISPSSEISGEGYATMKDWTYNKGGLAYNEDGYTYDGYYGFHSSKQPKMSLKNIKQIVKIN